MQMNGIELDEISFYKWNGFTRNMAVWDDDDSIVTIQDVVGYSRGKWVVDDGVLYAHCAEVPDANPFIVFEGIDNSGKTTVSKRLAELHPWYNWMKEPVFTTEMADRLNSADCDLSDAEREVMFLEGRLLRQREYNSKPVILDRYLWSGLAYAKAFSPSIFEFCKSLYQNHAIFRMPTVTIFMETPVATCQSREPSLTIERLETLREAYRATESLVHSPVVYVDGRMSIEDCVRFCECAINDIIANGKKGG